MQTAELKEQLLVTDEQRLELQAKDHDFLDLRKEKTDVEIDFKTLQMELRQCKDDAERALNDYQREKEAIFTKARKATEMDIQKALKDLEETQLASRRLDKKLRDKVLRCLSKTVISSAHDYMRISTTTLEPIA